MSDRATELEWLRWFYNNADFGPADDDVYEALKEAFMRQTGLKMPDGYDEP
jgi:hypothetical protein